LVSQSTVTLTASADRLRSVSNAERNRWMDNSRLGGTEEENDKPILSSFAGTEEDFLLGGRLAHYKGKPKGAVHEEQALASADSMQGLAHRAMVSH